MKQKIPGSRISLPRRADLQSLRALAILIVVGAHAHIPGMQGGYVGVDVFFVLSGYLISGLILNEVETTRRFNAWAFYARRLKRLLPALLLALLVVAGVAWMLVSPQQQREEAAAGQAATIWFSNFYFSARVINYFSAGLGGNLFLHTWSLAVEEQFYLIWPWLLLFLLGVWSWQGAPFSRKRLAIGFGLLAAASLTLGVYWAQADVEAGFYLMPGRVWEFALGALIFLLRQALDHPPHPQPHVAQLLNRWRGRSRLNAGGWLLILAVTVLYPDDLRYPGLWALLPCLGAAMVLLDAPEQHASSALSRLMLRTPALQVLGNLSYSLYLWHWPVLLLGGQILGTSWLARIGLIALCVALAALTYAAVERPVRRAPMRQTLNVFVPSALGMVLGFFVMGAWQNAAIQNLHSPAQSRIQMARMDIPVLYSQHCDTWYHSAEVSECFYGPKDASHTVVMFGDSVLAQWFPAISEIYLKSPGWRLVVLTKSACSAQDISYYYPRIKSMYTVCDTWRRRAIDLMVQMRPDVVIMGSTHYGFTPQQWISGTRSVLKRLNPVTKAIAIVSPTPELGFDGPDCLSAKANWPDWLPSPERCRTTLKPATKQSVFDLLKTGAAPFRHVGVIDMRAAICPGGICRAQRDHRIVYRDGQHLTARFILSLAPKLAQALHQSHIPY